MLSRTMFNPFCKQEGDVIELCQVSDIRAGGLPKDMKLGNQLLSRHGEQLEEKSLTICSGTDYININYQHVICPSAEIAKVEKLVYFLCLFTLKLFSSRVESVLVNGSGMG